MGFPAEPSVAHPSGDGRAGGKPNRVPGRESPSRRGSHLVSFRGVTDFIDSEPRPQPDNARWATGHIVKHHDRYFINNDRGELIIARLSPQGYQEISRTKLIEPASFVNRRRELGAVNWTHPAYANRHIITRNDQELLRYSLEKP